VRAQTALSFIVDGRADMHLCRVSAASVPDGYATRYLPQWVRRPIRSILRPDYGCVRLCTCLIGSPRQLPVVGWDGDRENLLYLLHLSTLVCDCITGSNSSLCRPLCSGIDVAATV
jgi:hypothetical protein